MRKSIGTWLAVLVAFGTGIYLVWWAYEYDQYQYVVYSVPFFVASIGLFKNKRWSQYIYYILCTYIIIFWAYAIYKIYGNNWPSPNLVDNLISLIPGIFLVILNIGIILVVYKNFSVKNGLRR